MRAKLVSSAATRAEHEIELERFPVLIGRSPDAEIQPADYTVSQRHCEIEAINGRLLVRDLGSENGTFVNGVRIDMAPLMPGDKLTVARTSFIANYETPRATPSGATRARSQRQGETSLLDWDVGDELTFFDLVRLLDQQREIYRDRYLSQPPQAEPMFPDPPHPEHLEHLIVEEMKLVGAEPQFIHAFEKTGVLVTEFNYDSIGKGKLAQWQAAIEEYERQHGEPAREQRYPVGAVTMYGPDKTTTTMILAAVIHDENAEPVYRRWVGDSVKGDAEVKQAVSEFFRAHDVRSVIYVRENVGCPHQAGIDYPEGEDCPFCPYWSGRPRDG